MKTRTLLMLLLLVAGDLHAAGSMTVVENNVNLQLGTKSFGPVTIDDDVISVEISFTRNNWTDPAARLDVSFECSGDGAPFVFCGSMVAFGGPAVPGRPNIVRKRVDFPPGANRRVQTTYTVSGNRIRTTVTVEAKVAP